MEHYSSSDIAGLLLLDPKTDRGGGTSFAPTFSFKIRDLQCKTLGLVVILDKPIFQLKVLRTYVQYCTSLI
jgi:hypothetical protein